MDYEQFYRYLDSRPRAEIKDCLLRVTEVARKHSIAVDRNPSSASNETLIKLHRLQISQQVWFQHAVWSKFGSKSDEPTSLQSLKIAVGDLCVASEAGEFIVSVNKKIDEEVQFTSVDAKKLASEQVSSHTQSSLSANTTSRSVHRICSDPISNEDSSSDEQSSESEVASASVSDSESSVLPQRQKNKRKKRVPVGQNKKPNATKWTAEKDVTLMAAVSKYKDKGWVAVAKQVGFNLTSAQCRDRWSAYLNPELRDLRDDAEWSQAEINQLVKLVPEHMVQPYWSKNRKAMTKPRIDWKAIGKELGRLPHRCKDKWRFLPKEP